jgi:hypothetical protein
LLASSFSVNMALQLLSQPADVILFSERHFYFDISFLFGKPEVVSAVCGFP